ncbi:MAG: HDOD domain-containing protein [Nitrospirae bacterium]|nr:HDOD domain-containing protein [Nitrospirota bacterium]
MSDSLKQYVQKITQLPTIPVVAQEILKLVHDELTSVDKLDNIIENDPPITAKILSVANSAFFGYKTTTQTIHDAIIRIGFNNVKDVALGVSLMTVFEERAGRVRAFDYQRIFNHSVTVGAVAQLISKDLKMKFAEEIFMNGILHDLGYLVLNKYFPDTYMQVLSLFEKGENLLEAEKEVLEFTHAEIGAWLAEKWNLPEGVLETILYHHNPSLAKKNLKRVAVIHIADYIVSKGIFSVTKTNPDYPLDSSSLSILEISEDYLKEVEGKITAGEVF